MEFKIGDVVKHKTLLNSPMMTVSGIYPADSKPIWCRWFDKSECLQTMDFDVDELVLVAHTS